MNAHVCAAGWQTYLEGGGLQDLLRHAQVVLQQLLRRGQQAAVHAVARSSTRPSLYDERSWSPTPSQQLGHRHRRSGIVEENSFRGPSSAKAFPAKKG